MAGLTIAVMDVELCDCFLEYGETTAEMALLFTFVLLGSSLIWSGFALLSAVTLLFAVLTLLVRPVAFLLALAPSKIDSRSRNLIAWFGPRGLSSLLLILLPVFAGLPGSERIFSLCTLVVVFSVVLHGGSLMVLGRTAPRPAMEGPAASPEGPPAGPDARADSLRATGADEERMTVEEMRRLQEAGEAVLVLDARSHRSYDESDGEPAGSLRIDPNRAVATARAHRIPLDAWLATLCA
jgi:NhaP-type Na+/H+ and K+/H+ antiporter